MFVSWEAFNGIYLAMAMYNKGAERKHMRQVEEEFPMSTVAGGCLRR